MRDDMNHRTLIYARTTPAENWLRGFATRILIYIVLSRARDGAARARGLFSVLQHVREFTRGITSKSIRLIFRK